MPERVLIAHPDAAERSRLAGIVAAAGGTPLEAADGEAALARRGEIDLALVAAALPAVDGLAVAARLRDASSGGLEVILLNDVYPVAAPKERFLRDFGLAQAIASPPPAAALTALLARRDRRVGRARREDDQGVDLAETPLLLLLGRARRRVETSFVYLRRDRKAVFVVLHKGDVASVRSNRTAGDEGALADALLWPDGEAFVYVDPAIEETTTPAVDLLPLLEQASRGALPPALAAAADRSLVRAARTVFQPADAQPEIAELVGLGLFERTVLELIDGERSASRLAGLCQAAGLPLGRLLLRLEALGLVARRRPGAKASPSRPALAAPTAVLPSRSDIAIAPTGGLDPGELPRLLLRLEALRATCVLAVRRGGRTVEMALRDGRITGAHAWGGPRSEDDPIEKLAEFGELRPEDVPALRRLHAQRLVLDALCAPDCDYTLRKGEVYRMAETLGVNPAALVAELLRAGVLPAPAGEPPPAEGFDATAAALALGAAEKSALEDFILSGEPPALAWLAGLGPLLDPATPIGHAAGGAQRALAAAPPEVEGKVPEQDLERLFEKAMDQGLREGAMAGARRAAEVAATPAPAPPPATGTATEAEPATAVRPVPATASAAGSPPAHAVDRPPALPPRPPREAIPPLPEEDVPEDMSAFALTLGQGHGSPQSFSMEQRSGGVVIRVGDREYAIDLLIKEAEELRRERNRLRGELVRRHTLLVERDEEVESVRKTVHELENFIHELQATVIDKEKAFRAIESSRGEVDSLLAELQAVAPEKDRLITETQARNAALATEAERIRERIRERERALEDLKRERDGLKERSARLDAEVKSRGEELRESEERLGVLKERSSRLEQDLSVARAERDDLTARLAASESEKRPRGFFRDARAERAAIDERVESAQKLAEERHRALDTVRAELVTVSHRVIDLEGQVARRDAEIGRLQRERERLEEKLRTALAENLARAESEAANRTRREEAERVLRERSTALELRGEELLGLRRLHDQVAAELEAARAALAERERSLEALSEQRSVLRNRVGELESGAAALHTELATLREERERLEWTADEVRQTCERATSALEAVRAARDELGSRLAETIAQKSRAEEERERYLAEARRIEGELRRERELRAEETSTLVGKLTARDQEQAALEHRLQAAASENGTLTDRAGALGRERDHALARAGAAEQKAAALAADVQRLTRELDAAGIERQRGVELAETLSARDVLVLELGSELRAKQAALDEQQQETITLLEKLQASKHALEEKRRQEVLASAETRRREVEQLVARHKAEVAALALSRDQERGERDRAIEELKNRVVEGEARLGHSADLEAQLRGEIERREAAIQTLQAELEKSSSERRQLAEELETKVASKVAHVQKLEAGLARLKEEAIKEIGNWKGRAASFDQKAQAAVAAETHAGELLAAQKAESERLDAQMTGARKRIAQDVRRISELVAMVDDQRARISERDAQIEALRTELGRREEDRQRLETELASRGAEADAFRDAAADREGKLATASESMYALSQHDRELSQQLTEQEELIANLKADLGRLSREKESALAEMERSRDAALAAVRGREVEAARAPLLERIAQLNRGLEEKTTIETALRAEVEGLYQEIVSASQALEEAHQQTGGLIDEMDRRLEARAAAEKTAARVRELEEQVQQLQIAIGEHDQAYDLLDVTLAARERLVEELERRVEKERSRADALARSSAPSVEARLRTELSEAGRALAEMAVERDGREALKARLDTVFAERDLLQEDIRRLRSRPVAAADPPARGSGDGRRSTPIPAAAPPSPELEVVVREKQALLEASSQYNREVTRLRDGMERKRAELDRIERELGQGDAGSPDRRELETARQAAEDEVHALQASLGGGTVKMAEMNRQIVEKNRLIQQLIERHDPGEIEAAPATPAAARGDEATASAVETGETSEAEANPENQDAGRTAPPPTP